MSPPSHVLPQGKTSPPSPSPLRSRTPCPPSPCAERSSRRPLPRKAPPHSIRPPVLPAPPPAAAAATTTATASATPIKPPAGQLITICKQLKPMTTKCSAAPRKERHAKECRSSPLMLCRTRSYYSDQALKRRCVRHKWRAVTGGAFGKGAGYPKRLKKPQVSCEEAAELCAHLSICAVRSREIAVF